MPLAIYATNWYTCLKKGLPTPLSRRLRYTVNAWPLCAAVLYCVNVATLHYNMALLTNDGRRFEVSIAPNGCVTFTVRRYNHHVVGFAGIREHVLINLRDKAHLLPANLDCALLTVPSMCAKCKRSLTQYPAVSYLPCGHSCLCTDCDELCNGLCFNCKCKPNYKLKFRK